MGFLYIYGKKQLREIDRRVRYLEKRLDQCTIVDRLPIDRGIVFFGAWVTLEDEDGNLERYRIVGPDEIDHHEAYISMDSPVAKALLKRRDGDEVVLRRVGGDRTFFIEQIEYLEP
ncbi:GreA/GreB family elongation factor [Marinomonas gallaica]|uniref:GreA/GreB family elongation factor n=1 Tax=Marinomonas gallaica TaxID=1806667 RepID=UPI003A900E38